MLVRSLSYAVQACVPEDMPIEDVLAFAAEAAPNGAPWKLGKDVSRMTCGPGRPGYVHINLEN